MILKSVLVSLINIDVVLGPSKDGGFYFVGVKNNAHEVFKYLKLDHITLNRIIDECLRYKFDYGLTRVLKDIDSCKDLLIYLMNSFFYAIHLA